MIENKALKSKRKIDNKLIIIAVMIFGFFCYKIITYKPVDTRPILNILFVGNSYTTSYGMTKYVEYIADIDPDGMFQLHVDVFADNGAALSVLWAKSDRNLKLKEQKWDYIVLQPQSLWATSEGNFFKTQTAMRLWVNAIREVGAKPVFFMTWPRRAGSHWYRNPRYNLKNMDNMHLNIYNATSVIERQYSDLIVVPVGDYWMYAMDLDRGFNLYFDDGSHPSSEGTYFNALLFYKYLVGNSVNDLRARPKNISKEKNDVIVSVVMTDLPR